MRRLLSLCFAFVAAATSLAHADAAAADASLKLYAVRIYRTGYESIFGNGVYLGNGVVLTAAHVAGLGLWREPLVGIAGKKLPTTILKDGHFHGVDLELLSIDMSELPASLALRRMPLCTSPSWPGEPVIVAAPESVARSKVMAPATLARFAPPEFRTAIAYVADSGNSGSGVFDARKKCLLGIITRQITRKRLAQEGAKPLSQSINVAKYFVPASTIAGFIPRTVRF